MERGLESRTTSCNSAYPSRFKCLGIISADIRRGAIQGIRSDIYFPDQRAVYPPTSKQNCYLGWVQSFKKGPSLMPLHLEHWIRLTWRLLSPKIHNWDYSRSIGRYSWCRCQSSAFPFSISMGAKSRDALRMDDWTGNSFTFSSESLEIQITIPVERRTFSFWQMSPSPHVAKVGNLLRRPYCYRWKHLCVEEPVCLKYSSLVPMRITFLRRWSHDSISWITCMMFHFWYWAPSYSPVSREINGDLDFLPMKD
jgi:hypothetical protein